MDKCPECGADLTGIDVRAHALSHWPETIIAYPENAEARRRQALLFEEHRRRMTAPKEEAK